MSYYGVGDGHHGYMDDSGNLIDLGPRQTTAEVMAEHAEPVVRWRYCDYCRTGAVRTEAAYRAHLATHAVPTYYSETLGRVTVPED